MVRPKKVVVVRDLAGLLLASLKKHREESAERRAEVTRHGCRYCWESSQPEITAYHCQSQDSSDWNFNGCHESFQTLADLTLHRSKTGGCRWPENIAGMLYDDEGGVWYRKVESSKVTDTQDDR